MNKWIFKDKKIVLSAAAMADLICLSALVWYAWQYHAG